MTDKEKLLKLRKLADDMYYAAANLGPTIGSGEHLRKTMKEYHKFIIHEYHNEEPVSEDLELTWEDFALIRLAFDATEANINLGGLKISPMTKEYYEEVLKLFKKEKCR